ncbi:MAG: hypothetical protein PHI85_05560 [Victivallaceae bacterium]|nr:hypothetical protein [Victivallaceae bacterium]
MLRALFAIFAVLSAVLCGNAATTTPPAPPERAEVAAASDFTRLTKEKPYRSALPHLREIGIDCEKIQSPADWLIEWASIPADCVTGERNGHFFASTGQTVTMYGPFVTPESREYLLELTVSVPEKSDAPESRVSVGVYRYGLYSPGALREQQTENVAKGERKTVSTVVRFRDDLPGFRPMIRISGDITLESLTVTRLNDDLSHDGLTIVEGTLEECSAIPDPAKSDYPDCRFVCRFVGNSIIRGEPCPKEFSAILEAFSGYKLMGTKGLKAGDKVRCLVVPFTRLSDEQKTTQQADDLNLFTLESYYVAGVSKIGNFADAIPAAPASGIFFLGGGDKYVSIFDRQINPPVPAELRRLQTAAIADDLAEMKRLLAQYDEADKAELNREFTQKWRDEQTKDADGFNRVNGIVWRNVDNSFWCLPRSHMLIPASVTLPADKMAAVTALRDVLEANGCQLIVAIIPDSYSISARVINKDFRDIPDFQSAELVKQLSENGVEAVYIADELIRNYNRFPWPFFFPDNRHPSDTAQDVLTDMIARRLSRYGFPENLDSNLFSIIQAPHVYGDAAEYRYPVNCDIGENRPDAAYKCRKVLYDGKEINPDPESPVLVFGNSFIQTPMSFPDSFPTLLASKLNMGIMSYRSGGHGPMTTGIQQLFSDAEHILAGKQVMVLVQGTHHLLAAIRFNNIREMDRSAMLLSGKGSVAVYEVKSNTPPGSTAFNWLNNQNLFAISSTGKDIVADVDEPGWDPTRDAVAVIPTCLAAGSPANFILNGAAAEIPQCYEKFSHIPVICKIPAGTSRLRIEVAGKPGTVLSIPNITIYQ